MFGGLEDNEILEPELPPDEAELRSQCEVELDHYLKDKGQQLRKENKKEYNDPLCWWKENEHKYPVIAALAKLFLAIPASTAPSERVWSRAARLISTIKRANLKEDVSSGMMFVRENLLILKKYYEEVSKKIKGVLPLKFAGLPECITEKDDEIDVGAD